MDTSPALSRKLGKTLWFGYRIDATDAQIRDMFSKRFGYMPAEILRQASIVLAGPVNQIAQEGVARALDGENMPQSTFSPVASNGE